MAKETIDYDRGVRIRYHPAGFRVYMYWDQPGVYLDNRGHIVSDKVGEAAGFDVKKLAKEKARRTRAAELLAENDRDFDAVEEDEPVFEQDGFRVVRRGKTFAIKDPDGNILSKGALGKEFAIQTVRELADAEQAGERPEQPEEEQPNAKAS